MCGRYSLASVLEIIQERFSFDTIASTFSPRYNIAPGQNAPVVVGGDQPELRFMRWGLVPSWAKDQAIGYKMINARAETIAEKVSFKRLLPSRRCLVLSDGFYEWFTPPDSKTKVPLRFTMHDNQPFSMAGLWDRWISPDKEELATFTIITTNANDLVSQYHNRMPVIFERASEQVWLDTKEHDQDRLLSLLKPYPAERMDHYEVSTLINSPRNDIPDCIRDINLP